MYAKLVFNASVGAGLKVRDVVRLITDSNSGSASLSNLENIDTNASELVAGTNSGWSLASGFTLPSTGTAVSASDSQYILQSACATSSKTKYASVHVNGSWTSSTSYDGSQFSFLIGPVTRYGESDQETLVGYNSTSASMSYRHWAGSDYVDNTVHIFATPYKLLMIGTSGASTTYNDNICGIIEFAENGTTTAKSLPPYFWFGSSYCSGGADPWGSLGTNATQTYGGIQMIWPETYYHNSRGIKPRYWVTLNDNPIIDNGTYERLNLYDGTSDGVDVYYYFLSSTDGINPYRYADEGDSPAGWFNLNPSLRNPSLYNTTTGFSGDVYRTFDGSTGARINVVRPIINYLRTGEYGIVDLTNAGLYETGGQLGSHGDNLSIGSDDYYYWTDKHTNYIKAILIKKD